MATLVDNNIFLKFDTVEVQAYFKEVSMSFSNATVDTTRGAGTDWNQRAAGLHDVSMDVSLAYDATNVQAYVQKLARGATITVEYGPEGATTGKPKHVQSMIVQSNDFAVTADKQEVVFSISLQGADTPSVDLNAGGVYS